MIKTDQTSLLLKLEEILIGHGFRLLERVGEGGFASCWKAERIDIAQIFVVKIIKVKDSMKNSMEYQSYESEIEALTHLTHTNIIHCYSYFKEENYLFVILEYCPGGSLDSIIKEKRLISTNVLLNYAYSLLLGLNYMHNQKIAHLDIKPSNILIDQHGRIKFADFGLATFVKDNKSNRYLGSIAFMAPEILAQQPYDPFKADVWSIGMTIYYLAFRQLPWPSSNRHEYERMMHMGFVQIPISADPAIKQLIVRSIVVNPNNRADVSELLDNFRTTTEGKIQLVKTLTPQITHNKITNIPKSIQSGIQSKLNPRARKNTALSRNFSMARSLAILPSLK